MANTLKLLLILIIFSFAIILVGNSSQAKTDQKQDISMNRHGVKKVVFIHHSVGGHWLSHEDGQLVAELNKNGFYVNDITYGWQPPWIQDSWVKKTRNKIYSLVKYNPFGAYQIGDRTDIGHLFDWFIGPDSQKIMQAVFTENHESTTFGNHANLIANPGLEKENDIVMIKPCYPNSLYRGPAGAPANSGPNPQRNFEAGSEEHTVANAKRIYNDIIQYFKTRSDKFFIIVTAPPRRELPENGQVARVFSNWLVNDWLQENTHENKNVMVFDLYNVLTSGADWTQNDLGHEGGNHHRMWQGKEQHVVQVANHVLVYPKNGTDNHPARAGYLKATHEFVELFTHRYQEWIDFNNK